MKRNWPDQVDIVEVGPRDGLQNESAQVPTSVKVEFIRKLVDAGLRNIEATSFVHPKAIPQLADAVDVIAALPAEAQVTYSALVPNEKGLERALASGIKRIAVFTAASETFARKNINMSVEESLSVFAPVVRRATDAGLTVRGYLSTCFFCPYEGRISGDRVVSLTARLLDLGVDEVAVSDTIGAATPQDVLETVGAVLNRVKAKQVALHFHDTYGTALANVLAGLEMGIATFDASAGGLGGCPYAPGASGNLSTEDLVYMLHGMGISTGVDLEKLVTASSVLATFMGRDLPSRNWKRMCGQKVEGSRHKA